MEFSGEGPGCSETGEVENFPRAAAWVEAPKAPRLVEVNVLRVDAVAHSKVALFSSAWVRG